MRPPTPGRVMHPKTRKVLEARERARLHAEEQKRLAREDQRAATEGVAERVALGQERGEAFEPTEPVRKGRQPPVRRMSGLEWLTRQGKITEAQAKAGALYGEAWRLASAEATLKSCLNSGGGGGDGPNLAAITQQARRRMMAEYRLEGMRQTLRYQRALTEACDLICGQEKTPREARANGLEAGKLEAALLIALDLLVNAMAEPHPSRTAR